MMTTPIRAVDERVLPFAPDQIWPVLADVNGYPQWYPSEVGLWRACFSLHKPALMVTTVSHGQFCNQRRFIWTWRLYGGDSL